METLIYSVGYFAIVVCMFTNGITGLPPSPFVYVTAGLLVSAGEIDFLPTVLLGTFGNVLGNIVVYETVRRKGVDWAIGEHGRFRKYATLVCGVHKVFEKKGVRMVLFGKFLPVIKVVIPIVSGVASMDRRLFVIATSAGSLIWAIYSVGFARYFGDLVKTGDTAWPTVIAFLSVLIAIKWFVGQVKASLASS